MTRRRFSEREVIDTLMRQGANIPCGACGELLTRLDLQAIEREHIHELALGGKDEPANCRYSHVLCHKIVTNGTPATTAGSSKNRIAKTKGTRASKFQPVKLPIDQERPERPRFGRR